MHGIGPGRQWASQTCLSSCAGCRMLQGRREEHQLALRSLGLWTGNCSGIQAGPDTFPSQDNPRGAHGRFFDKVHFGAGECSLKHNLWCGRLLTPYGIGPVYGLSAPVLIPWSHRGIRVSGCHFPANSLKRCLPFYNAERTLTRSSVRHNSTSGIPSACANASTCLN